MNRTAIVSFKFHFKFGRFPSDRGIYDLSRYVLHIEAELGEGPQAGRDWSQA